MQWIAELKMDIEKLLNYLERKTADTHELQAASAIIGLRQRVAELEAKCRWHEEGSASMVGYPWDTPFNDGYDTAKNEFRQYAAELEKERDHWKQAAQNNHDRLVDVQAELDAVEAERDALKLERDSAYKIADHYRDERDAAIKLQDEANALLIEQARTNESLKLERDELLAASCAVVDRWDSALWKDLPHTGEYIHRLREAIASVKEKA